MERGVPVLDLGGESSEEKVESYALRGVGLCGEEGIAGRGSEVRGRL
jgi:hypothetical protein